jgi:hypothetical protein
MIVPYPMPRWARWTIALADAIDFDLGADFSWISQRRWTVCQARAMVAEHDARDLRACGWTERPKVSSDATAYFGTPAGNAGMDRDALALAFDWLKKMAAEMWLCSRAQTPPDRKP